MKVMTSFNDVVMDNEMFLYVCSYLTLEGTRTHCQHI